MRFQLATLGILSRTHSIGTSIKTPIPCEPVEIDLFAITAAIERPGRDVHVEVDEIGMLRAYVTPSSAVPSQIAAELSYLHQCVDP